jgi:undecaprenyl-diphosphatase
MDIILALKALVMGLVEGFTEFLPISSPRQLHLPYTPLTTRGSADLSILYVFRAKAGAIFAVCWEYRARIAAVLSGLFSDRKQQRFAINVCIAFLPAAVLGVAFNKAIKAVLFKPVPVALAFIIGGLVILLVERSEAKNPGMARITSVDDMTPVDAIKIGLAQAFALIPGTSRSGATIMGSMMFGLSRQVATEFSFFLAIPTLLGATVYSLYKERALLSAADLPLFGIGSAAAFVSAFLCVRWLLRYISTHTFTYFAWYRIVFGLVVIATAHYGLVQWVD